MKRAAVALTLIAAMAHAPAFAEDITLFKHAYRTTTPPPPETQYPRYRVRQGDTLKKIFIKDFGARPEELPALFRKFRQYNPRVRDLNRIIEDYSLTIPLDAKGQAQKDKTAESAGTAPSQPMPSGNVVVIKKGQHLVKVLREMYGLSDETIFHEYIGKIKKLNPDIEDLNLLVEGQKVKLPAITPAPQGARTAPAPRAAVQKPVVAEKSRAAEPGKTRRVRIVELPGNQAVAPAKKEAVPPAQIPAAAAAPVVAPAPAAVPVPAAGKKGEALSEVAVVKPAGSKPAPQGGNGGAEASGQSVSTAAEKAKTAAEVKAQEAKDAAAAEKARADTAREKEAIEVVQGSLLPAFREMGYRERDRGTYFLPVAGDRIVSINAGEIPIIDLDMGKRIIMDVNNKISPETRRLIEQAYPDTKVISGPAGGKETLMERLLDACGYFSVNKDAGPVLVGEDEKIRLFGKWVIYKDKSRRSVIVINVLSDEEYPLPEEIRAYAARFGIRLVEMGGKRGAPGKALQGGIKGLGQSYEKLFGIMGVAYEKDKLLSLVNTDSLKISYPAPILVGRSIITDDMPDKTMFEMLQKSGYKVINGKAESLGDVLDALGIKKLGPPVRIVIAKNRAELDLPAVQAGDTIILEHQVDKEIVRYLTSSGVKAIVW